MANLSVQALQSKEERKELYGQVNSVPQGEKPKGHWFKVWEGLVTPEHVLAMRVAVWLFLWCINRTTNERGEVGSVMGGAPIGDGRIARDLGVTIGFIRAWRKRLVAKGYIKTRRTPYGFVYEVQKSKKWKRVRTESEAGERVDLNPNSRVEANSNSEPERVEASLKNKEEKIVVLPKIGEIGSKKSDCELRTSFPTPCKEEKENPSYRNNKEQEKPKPKRKNLEENLAQCVAKNFLTIDDFLTYRKSDGDRAEWGEYVNGWLEAWRSACLAVGYMAKRSDPYMNTHFLDILQEEVVKRTDGEHLTISPARVCMKIIDACIAKGIPFPPSFRKHKDRLWAEECAESEAAD